jgi:hypothetical protein
MSGAVHRRLRLQTATHLLSILIPGWHVDLDPRAILPFDRSLNVERVDLDSWASALSERLTPAPKNCNPTIFEQRIRRIFYCYPRANRYRFDRTRISDQTRHRPAASRGHGLALRGFAGGISFNSARLVGVDSFQALMLAQRLARQCLTAFIEERGGAFWTRRAAIPCPLMHSSPLDP